MWRRLGRLERRHRPASATTCAAAAAAPAARMNSRRFTYSFLSVISELRMSGGRFISMVSPLLARSAPAPRAGFLHYTGRKAGQGAGYVRGQDRRLGEARAPGRRSSTSSAARVTSPGKSEKRPDLGPDAGQAGPELVIILQEGQSDVRTRVGKSFNRLVVDGSIPDSLKNQGALPE